MKPISPALQAHLNGELKTLAYLVKITREDGIVKGFTARDRNLVVAGVTYKADGALTPNAIESSSRLATDNLEITGILNSSDITESDIEGGLYDHARIDVYACNWADLTQGTVRLRRGWLGEVEHVGTHYVAELRGLHAFLERPLASYYTPECRYDRQPQHVALATSSEAMIHAFAVAGDAVETIFGDYWRWRLVGVYRLPIPFGP